MALVSLIAHPDAPDSRVVVVLIDPTASVEEHAVEHLGSSSYESNDAWYVLQSDAWVERHLDGGCLTLDFVAHSHCLQAFPWQSGPFVARSIVDPSAIRLLRVIAQVDPIAFAQASPETWVVVGASFAEAAAALAEGDLDPLVFAPSPTARQAAP